MADLASFEELHTWLQKKGTFHRVELYRMLVREKGYGHRAAVNTTDNILRSLQTQGALIYENHTVGWRYIT